MTRFLEIWLTSERKNGANDGAIADNFPMVLRKMSGISLQVLTYVMVAATTTNLFCLFKRILPDLAL